MNQKNKKKVEVDLFVDPRELTQTEKVMLTEFIRKDKLNNKVFFGRSRSRSHQQA